MPLPGGLFNDIDSIDGYGFARRSPCLERNISLGIFKSYLFESFPFFPAIVSRITVNSIHVINANVISISPKVLALAGKDGSHFIYSATTSRSK